MDLYKESSQNIEVVSGTSRCMFIDTLSGARIAQSIVVVVEAEVFTTRSFAVKLEGGKS